MPTRYLRRWRGIRTGPTRSAAFIARPTAARTSRKSCPRATLESTIVQKATAGKGKAERVGLEKGAGKKGAIERTKMGKPKLHKAELAQATTKKSARLMC